MSSEAVTSEPASSFDHLSSDREAGVVLVTPDGHVSWVNRTAERILGIKAGDKALVETPSTYGCYATPELRVLDRESFPLWRALRGERIGPLRFYLRNDHNRDGMWVRADCLPLRNGRQSYGAVMLLRGSSPDVLPSPVAEPHEDHQPACPHCGDRFFLRSRYEQICRAIEQTADSVVITNRDGVIEYVNAAFEQTTGFTAEDAIGNTPRILKSGRQEPKFYEEMWQTLMSGRPFRGTIVNRKKTGELYWAEQTITPMTDSMGRITNFVSVLKDITQLLRSKEQEFFLSLAREIQQRFYGTSLAVDGFDLHGEAKPADETGGDYFDFIAARNGMFTAVVADVSGHGVGAALVMSETRAYCRAYGSMNLPPDEVLKRVNERLHDDLGGRAFATMAALAIDPREKTFAFCGGGHVPALLVSRHGTVRYIRSSGLPLGLFRDAKIEMTGQQPIEPGDVVVLLTDGITESTSPDGEELGLARAAEIVVASRGESAATIVHALFDGARRHAAGEPQIDDMAAVVCKSVE